MKLPPQTTCAVSTCDRTPTKWTHMRVPMRPFEIMVPARVGPGSNGRDMRFSGPPEVEVQVGFCEDCFGLLTRTNFLAFSHHKPDPEEERRP